MDTMKKTRLTEQDLHRIIKETVYKLFEKADGGIDIDPKNKGKFTATQKKSGKSTEELCHSKNPLTRKRANFAKMARRHWKPLKESSTKLNVADSSVRQIVRESIERAVQEADRHREGYWKERWQKQKAAKQANGDEAPKESKKSSSAKKDRHRKGYYHDYNQAHPERLDRGFTKGYNNGNVSDGVKTPKRKWLDKALGIYIIGYDEFGMPITNNPFGDMLRDKEVQWHDDDWVEDDD